MILSNEQFEKAKRSVFLKGSHLVKLPVDLYSNIMLITSSCGRGKSTYALSLDHNGLLADINERQRQSFFPSMADPAYKDIQPEEVLMLSSRLAITEQQLKNRNVVKAQPADFDNISLCFYDEESSRNGKIRATTAHAFGSMIKNGYVKKLPKVIIIDEIHSLFMEYFAEQLRYVIQFLEDNKEKLIKIGLTATPEVLEDYVKEFTFERIDLDIDEKYLTNKLVVCVNGKASSILKQYEGKINDDYKVIYYTQSATQCYKLSQEYENSSFMISRYNTTVIKDKVNNTEINLVDVMNEQGVQQYVLNNERLPDGINILFINSACREGMNICDEKVKMIICEAPDMMTIKQVRGRIRNDLEEFIVVANFNYKVLNDNAIKTLVDLLKEAETNVNPQGLLGARYQKQLDNKAVQPFVYKYHDYYYINHYAEYYLSYIRDTYLMIDNSKEKDGTNRQGFYCSSGKVIAVNNRKILDYESYYKQLEKFVRNRQIQVKHMAEVQAERSKESALSIFQKIEENWLNRPLGTDDKKQLVAELAMTRSKGKTASWKTVKDTLLDAGYTIKQKRIGSKNYDIIEK